MTLQLSDVVRHMFLTNLVLVLSCHVMLSLCVFVPFLGWRLEFAELDGYGEFRIIREFAWVGICCYSPMKHLLIGTLTQASSTIEAPSL